VRLQPYKFTIQTLRRTLGVVAVVCGCLIGTAGAAQITYEEVTVGNPGNANDTTGYGAVSYSYQIGKYDVTIGQYTAFLNAVAKSDPYSLYNSDLAPSSGGGISRSGTDGAYSYSVIDSGARPIRSISWFDAARFANWMQNGQPTGAQAVGTTETGAYTLGGATSGDAVSKNQNATFYIPTENEWYKAAYYDPTKGGTGGYWTYATQSDTPPGTTNFSAANQANYLNAHLFSGVVTDVGAFTASASYYGTFDQSGNVYQWNDIDGSTGPSRGIRGGMWANDAFPLSSSNRGGLRPAAINSDIGFRLASPVSVSVPEIDPAGIGSVLALVTGALGLLERRRLKAA